MKIVVAIDSLKGSLTSVEAGLVVKEAVLSVFPDADVALAPVADGGEGTVKALVEGMNGVYETVEATGPLGQKVSAVYGILKESKTAIVEMAQAAGMTLVPVDQRNPMRTTTYGVGEIIADAISRGCRHFIVGIGGSATNDAGVGMLQALGFGFYDKHGNQVGLGGQALGKIASHSAANKLDDLADCTFRVACDVNNPLYGSNGAAFVYGPQKGADAEMVLELDRGLRNLASVVSEDLAALPGAGAAGGIGYGFTAFLGAKLEPGIEIITQETGLEAALVGADFVITGEGRIDSQTSMGKAPVGVAKLAKKHGAKVIALAGGLTDDAFACNDRGIDAFFSIQTAPVTLEEAMKRETASKNMRTTVIQLFNLIKSVST